MPLQRPPSSFMRPVGYPPWAWLFQSVVKCNVPNIIPNTALIFHQQFRARLGNLARATLCCNCEVGRNSACIRPLPKVIR